MQTAPAAGDCIARGSTWAVASPPTIRPGMCRAGSVLVNIETVSGATRGQAEPRIDAAITAHASRRVGIGRPRDGWALLALTALLASCSPPPAPTEDVRPVRVITVQPAATRVVAELSGEVRPRVETRVGFQVGGRIVSRTAEVGQTVAAGTLLATLDATDLALGATAAAAQRDAARVDRDQQRADIARFEDLRRQGFISAAELERRRAALDAAESRYAQAEALGRASANQAEYATLRAPAAGVVTAIDAEAGQVVAAGQSVVRVARADDKEVAVSIPEGRLAQLRQIGEVAVTLSALSADPKGAAPALRGRVREIAPVADPATRTFAARIALRDAPAAVALGMSATVRFEAPLPQPIIAVPMTALLREGDATYVWKLDRSAGKVSRQRVEVAGVSGNDIVLAAGVAPGDALVSAGVHLLRDGQSVRVLDLALGPAPAGSGPQPATPGR